MDSEAVRRTLQSLVDTRPSRCHDHAYEFTRLDSPDRTTSIVMSYHNTEFYSVKLALSAIVEHTPHDLYSEIVLLDDGSSDDRVLRAATEFLHDPKFSKVVDVYDAPHVHPLTSDSRNFNTWGDSGVILTMIVATSIL